MTTVRIKDNSGEYFVSATPAGRQSLKQDSVWYDPAKALKRAGELLHGAKVGDVESNRLTARLQELEKQNAELLAQTAKHRQSIRDAVRTAMIMHTTDGHEVVCLEPHLWNSIASAKGGA